MAVFTLPTLDSFSVSTNELSTFEDNNISIDIKYDASSPVTSIETFYFAVNQVTDSTDYETDMGLTYVNNSHSVSGNTLTVSLSIPASDLVFNGSYHVVVLVYDADDITSHITPVLIASHYPFTFPIITGTMTNEIATAANHIGLNQYENVTCKIVIDPTNYDNNQTTHGLTGTFDNNLFKVMCKTYRVIVNSATRVATPILASYTANEFRIVSGSGEAQKNGNNFEIETSFRFEINQSYIVRWTIDIVQPIGSRMIYNTIEYQQRITSEASDENITFTMLDINNYSSRSTAIAYTTEQDSQFVVQINKTEDLQGLDAVLADVVVVDNETGSVRTDVAIIAQDFDGNDEAYVIIDNEKLEKGKNYNLVAFLADE